MKLVFKFVLLFIVLLSISFYISDIYKTKSINNELKLHINDLKKNYNIILHENKLAADAIKYSILDFKDVKEILYKMSTLTKEQKDIYRKRLYDILKKDFATYKKMGVKLVLFSEPNNKIFLRLHKPDIYGDDISQVRFAIAKVNKTHKALFGFEEGKISHAFRHIYPVYDDNKTYIGSIDVSFSSERLQQVLDDVHKLHTNFLVNKNVLNSRIWTVKNVTAPYKQSIEHEGFMVSKRNKEHTFNLEASKKVLAQNKKLIDDGIAHSREFAVYGRYDNNLMVISFLPIHSILPNKQADAYLVSYSLHSNIPSIINDYLVINFFIGIIILLTLLLIFFMIKKRQDVLLTSKVFSTMNDGVVITDANQKIIRVNDAFCDITQYSKDELIGKSPHFIKSGWHNQNFYQQMWDDIISKGSWHGEVVDRKKDGSIYTAETSIFSIKNLEGHTTNFIAVSSDITLKKEQENMINNLAYYDMLTNLPNKIHFSDIFQNRLAAAKHHHTKLAVLFVDLDNFKAINDTHGHLVGDNFLKEASNRMKSLLREEDVLSRFGGDEFVILIENFKKPHVLSIISEKIVEAFEKPFMIDDIEVYSGASIGISIYPENGLTLDELTRTADTAMYHVKSTGKGRYEFFLDSMNEATSFRMSVEHALRTAIHNDEFYLTYQPKVNTSANKVYGMEALLRWESSSLGFVSPEIFIPVAEENGKINKIGLWVFEQAVRDTKKLHDEGNNLTVSVNVSTIQLEDENFLNQINKTINEVGISREYIELEITETQIMKNIDDILAKLELITSNGIKISIDDFGTGYSSLSQLKKIPATTIKIDKSFVLDIVDDEDDKEIVASIIDLSKIFKKDVIAEGSETKEHIEILAELGCEKIQGYYFSKPLKFEEFKSYLTDFNKK